MNRGQAILALLLGLGAVRAQGADLSSLYFFGDSLTDEGRDGRTAAVMWPELFRTDTGVTAGANYAIGGAITSNQPSPIFGDSSFLGQVNSFVASSKPIGPNPAAGIWIGANNIWIQSGQGVAPATIASSAAADVKTGITTLTRAGIPNYYLLGVYDLSLTNAYELAGTSTLAVRAAAASAAQRYNAELASLSVPGASIQYVNIANFINHLMTDPQAYGFTRILPLAPGQICTGACQQTSIFTDPIHLTSAAQTLVGNYVASGNYIYNGANFTYGAIAADVGSATESAPLPAELALSAARNFSDGLFTRLEATREAPPADSRLPAGAPGPAQPWSVFADGDLAGGSLAHLGPVAGYTSSLDYSEPGAWFGAQYQLQPDLRVGAVIDWGHVSADLTQTLGSRTSLDVYQAALYASWSRSEWFADGLLGAGLDSFRQTRLGTFGQDWASPAGSTLMAAARAGYLFRAGPIRVGPIVDVAYTRSAIGGYAESGGADTTIVYGGQASDAVEGGAGLEVRLADPARWRVNPFLAVSYEHEFVSGGQPISAAFAYLPTQSLPTAVYAGADAVQARAGAGFDLGRGWGGSVTAFGLEGLKGLSSYGVGGEVSFRF